MKRTLYHLIVVAMAVCGLLKSLDAQILVRKPIYNNPLIYVINKTVTNSWCNMDIYCQVYSSALAYVGSFYGIAHGIDVEVDPCWNRLTYTDQVDGQTPRMRDYGTFGFGVGNFNEPMAVKVVSRTSDVNWDSSYYWIYVADRQNHWVERLHYNWPTPDSGLIHDYYCNATMWQPTDLDVSNSGSFDNVWGYVTWVACKSDKIYAFNYGGAQILSYGSTGSGVGHFSDIRAIVCGKTLHNDTTGVLYANNRYVYVLDAGNNRIVRLTRSGYYTLQWDMTFVNSSCRAFTDLEVDALGHVWVTSENGTIFKFTKDLDVLGTFGSSGTGPNQFDYPVSIANTGGHLGGGNMIICENWTAQSGQQNYAIGTDVNDLFVNPKDMAAAFAIVTYRLSWLTTAR